MFAMAGAAILIEQGFAASDGSGISGLGRWINDDRARLERRQCVGTAEFEYQQAADIAQIARHGRGLAAAQGVAAAPAAEDDDLSVPGHLEYDGRREDP